MQQQQAPKVRLANGKVVDTLGNILVKLEIRNDPGKPVVGGDMQVDLLVLSGLDYDIVLGQDWFVHYNLTVDWQSRLMLFGY